MSKALVIDYNDTGTVQYSFAYSINASMRGSDYGVSFGSYNMFTNAANVFRLVGDSHQLGVGATAPIPYTNMNGFAESNFVMMPAKSSSKCYVGYSDFKGISTYGSPDINAHYTGGYTPKSIWSFNIFDFFGG